MNAGLQNFVRQVNKHLTNRITARMAGSTPTPFALVRHIGRRSGKVYETPIIVQPTTGGFVIALTYGANVDWYRNVMAAGHCQIRWHQRDYAVDQIESIDAATGLRAFAPLFRGILNTLGTSDFVSMRARPI